VRLLVPYPRRLKSLFYVLEDGGVCWVVQRSHNQGGLHGQSSADAVLFSRIGNACARGRRRTLLRSSSDR